MKKKSLIATILVITAGIVLCFSKKPDNQPVNKGPSYRVLGDNNENSKGLKITNDTDSDISLVEYRIKNQSSDDALEGMLATTSDYSNNLLGSGNVIEAGETVILFVPLQTYNKTDDSESVQIAPIVDMKIGIDIPLEDTPVDEEEPIEEVDIPDQEETFEEESNGTEEHPGESNKPNTDIYEITGIDTSKTEAGDIVKDEEGNIDLVYTDADTGQTIVNDGIKVDTVPTETVEQEKDEIENVWIPQEEVKNQVVDSVPDTSTSQNTDPVPQAPVEVHHHSFDIPVTENRFTPAVTETREEIIGYDEWEEPIYEWVPRLICNQCGATFTTSAEFAAHSKASLLSGGNCGSCTNAPYQVQTGSIPHKDPIYGSKTYVITPEKNEVVTVGYKCSCGAMK